MKVLTLGLDDTTLAFLREGAVVLEKRDATDIKDADDLFAWLRDHMFDACVFDLEKSGLGVYAARSLRANKIGTPLIGVSKGSEDRTWGDYRALFLENGGDDLLRGPVNPRELIASLRAVTRRFKGALLDVLELHNGDAKLKVNLTTLSVTVNGMKPALSPNEVQMMVLLASTPGRVVSKEVCMQQFYGLDVDDEPEMKIIDVYLCKLRKNLEEVHPDTKTMIETVWGRGYRLLEQSELKPSEVQAA